MNQTRELRVPVLSDILKSPIERGKMLVGLYEPSAQWLSLLLTIMAEALRLGHVVGIVTLATPPSQIRQRLALAVPNLEELDVMNRFTIIDWYTWMTGRKSTERRSVDTLSLAQFNIQDSKYQREDSPRYDLLANDNLSVFLKYNDERSFMQWLDKTTARMREFRGIRIYGYVKRFHSDAFYANLEAMADGVIELDNRQSGRKLENVIRLKSMKGIQHPTEWRTLTITKSGFVELASKR